MTKTNRAKAIPSNGGVITSDESKPINKKGLDEDEVGNDDNDGDDNDDDDDDDDDHPKAKRAKKSQKPVDGNPLIDEWVNDWNCYYDEADFMNGATNKERDYVFKPPLAEDKDLIVFVDDKIASATDADVIEARKLLLELFTKIKSNDVQCDCWGSEAGYNFSPFLLVSNTSIGKKNDKLAAKQILKSVGANPLLVGKIEFKGGEDEEEDEEDEDGGVFGDLTEEIGKKLSTFGENQENLVFICGSELLNPGTIQ